MYKTFTIPQKKKRGSCSASSLLLSLASNSLGHKSASLIFFFFLSGCNCAWMERVVLVGVAGCVVWFPLLSFSQGFHGRREVPVLLLGLIYIYLLISALFTTEWSVTSTNLNQSQNTHQNPSLYYRKQIQIFFFSNLNT